MNSFLLFFLFNLFSNDRSLSQSPQPTSIWEVRSVDTMKTSRDMAREKLNDLSYDAVIERDLNLIKDLGANYVAIDTPYDEEFYPYLSRWVTKAREAGLKIWFRGNFSAWEGWFGYKKSMTPEEHLKATSNFIDTHPDIFEDGDAFDPCPECENAGWWVQPKRNKEYNQFVIDQQVVLRDGFKRIGKNVHTNWTGIIGGRAREVLNEEAVLSLSNIVAIDHYTNSTENMNGYIQFFQDTFNAKTLLSEFGAPIPDINGPMNESKQALFIDNLMRVFYQQKENVYGLNYFALNNGTTEIIDKKGNPKEAYFIIKKYYSPAIITGLVSDELGYAVTGEPVSTKDHISKTVTDSKGRYTLVVPAEPNSIIIGGNEYHPATHYMDLTYNENKKFDITLKPKNPSWVYLFHLKILIGIMD